MDKLVLQSRVSKKALQNALFWGTLNAFFGGLLIVIPAVFFGQRALATWGFMIILIGSYCIGAGLLPYQMLKKRENEPDTLILTPEGLEYHPQKGEEKKFSWEEVKKASYCSGKKEEKVTLHLQNEKEIDLPYFSERTAKEVEEHLQSITNNPASGIAD